MTDPQIALRELAERCVVRVGDRPDEGGSGVWVAPGIVLTCAHVVPAGLASKIPLKWDGHELTGTVVEQTPNATPYGRIWSFPDVALIEVESAPDHPCAWTAETEYAGAPELTALGYLRRLDDDDLTPAGVVGRYGGYEDRFWLLKSNEVRPGMSGGPVLDLATGVVCGLVKLSLEVDTDRGGYIVPIRALRELSVTGRRRMLRAAYGHHRRHQEWAALRAQLPAVPGALLTPGEEVDLFGRLAALPETDETELRRIYQQSAPHRRPPGVRLDAMLDVAHALLDSGGHDEDVRRALLRLGDRVAALKDWMQMYATSRGLAMAGAPPLAAPPPEIVTVEIAPGCAEENRFRLTVTVSDQSGRGRRLYCDESPTHTLDEVTALARDQLREALCWQGRETMIEFVVPRTLFAEQFEALRPIERKKTNLGRGYRVVLRDLDRQTDPYTRAGWVRRWQHLTEGTGLVRWATCEETLDGEQFSAELEAEERTSVVVLSRRPASDPRITELFETALDLGVPAVAWRRDTCAEHDNGTGGPRCSGAHFARALRPRLTAEPVTGLPALVQEIRIDAARQTPMSTPCHGIVLIWDDPRRAVVQTAPLTEPPRR